jgi:hypothetical protein
MWRKKKKRRRRVEGCDGWWKAHLRSTASHASPDLDRWVENCPFWKANAEKNGRSTKEIDTSSRRRERGGGGGGGAGGGGEGGAGGGGEGRRNGSLREIDVGFGFFSFSLLPSFLLPSFLPLLPSLPSLPSFPSSPSSLVVSLFLGGAFCSHLLFRAYAW